MVGLFNEDCLTHSLQIAQRLREAGLNVESVLTPQKLGKQFQSADKKGIPFVVMAGPDEMAAEQVSLKDLRSGEQTGLDLTDLVSHLRALLANA